MPIAPSLKHPALLALMFVVCGSFVLPASAARKIPAPPNTPPSPPPLRTMAPYSWPGSLAHYPIVATDFASGDVGLLGARTVGTGGGPHGLAIQPGGAFVWLMNSGGWTVWVFDRHLQRRVATIAVGMATVHAVFSPDGATAYVTDFGGSEVTIVDVATRRAIGHISTPSEPHAIAISPDGRTSMLSV